MLHTTMNRLWGWFAKTGKLIVLLVLVASTHAIAQDWQPKYVTADQADIKPFHYSATVTDIYDGDTITVRVDLGFNVCLLYTSPSPRD